MNTPPTTQAQSGMTMPQIPMNSNQNGPRIKSEPGMESPPIGMSQAPYANPITSIPNATTAQQRAVQHLQNSFGQRAAASINAIQGVAQQPQNAQQVMHQQQQHMQQQAMHHQQMQQMQQQRTGQMPGRPQPQMTQEQYRMAMAAQARQHVQAQNGQHGLNGAQTDGAGDDIEETFGIIKQVSDNGEETMGRVEIDGMIRQKIEAMGQRMEGGGLMLPLREASTAAKRQRKIKKSAAGNRQVDGPDSDDDDKDGVKDEEIDEDAINSDLDDPDDGLNDEEDDDEGMGHIMLCMYDKVQRVKNKWKCVMKDGVLTVNGKEYVFHKATGEYEW
ncbi:transcription factor IIA, alpha/beta subunit-domain-containing protein [Tricladium varicosporioides]|nr:transcription factor IIA, alpha/beta subunit-domain-containing protein [Hymenoscyphus varicosporioides]